MGNKQEAPSKTPKSQKSPNNNKEGSTNIKGGSNNIKEPNKPENVIPKDQSTPPSKLTPTKDDQKVKNTPETTKFSEGAKADHNTSLAKSDYFTQDWYMSCGPYQISRKLLGKGSYAEVRLATHTDKKEIFAAKIIDHKALLFKDLEMLKREIDLMKKLQHKHIAKLFDSYIIDKQSIIIMEYCNNGSIRKYTVKSNNLSQKEILKLMKEILSALSELHSRNIIHRDLKPDNILLHDGEVKIVDFGFARHVEQNDKKLLLSFVGTPKYAPMQVLNFEKYSAKCDVWSLGIIFYELLYGCHPFINNRIYFTEPAEYAKYLDNTMRNNKIDFGINQDRPKELNEIIEKMLRIDEEDRASMEEVMAVFNKLKADEEAKIRYEVQIDNVEQDTYLMSSCVLLPVTVVQVKDNEAKTANELSDWLLGESMTMSNKSKTTEGEKFIQSLKMIISQKIEAERAVADIERKVAWVEKEEPEPKRKSEVFESDSNLISAKEESDLKLETLMFFGDYFEKKFELAQFYALTLRRLSKNYLSKKLKGLESLVYNLLAYSLFLKSLLVYRITKLELENRPSWLENERRWGYFKGSLQYRKWMMSFSKCAEGAESVAEHVKRDFSEELGRFKQSKEQLKFKVCSTVNDLKIENVDYESIDMAYGMGLYWLLKGIDNLGELDQSREKMELINCLIGIHKFELNHPFPRSLDVTIPNIMLLVEILEKEKWEILIERIHKIRAQKFTDQI